MAISEKKATTPRAATASEASPAVRRQYGRRPVELAGDADARYDGHLTNNTTKLLLSPLVSETQALVNAAIGGRNEPALSPEVTR